MRLLELVSPRAIVADLAASDRNSAIRELVEALAAAGQVASGSVEEISRTIVSREQSQGTTGFGKGVAAPHAKIDAVSRVVGAVGCSRRGIDFAALDGELVYTAFLVLSPTHASSEHLNAMHMVFRHLHNDRFRRFLRQANSAEAIFELLKEADEQAPVR